MADSIGSICDKLTTTGQKMFLAQDHLYLIRKMTFSQFKETYGSTDEGLTILYEAFKKACDLNVQRQALILELDKKIIEIVQAAIKGENLDNGVFAQDQHKSY